MTAPHGLRAIPTDDRAWLLAALEDALAGGAPIVPIPAESLTHATEREAIEELQRAELPPETALVVRTSGSSGVPKAVALSAAALRASAAATQDLLGGPGQWLVALPVHLISGVQMLVRSAWAGTHPVFVDGHTDAVTLLAAADTMDAERRYVSLVPVQLARLLDHAAAHPEALPILQRFDAVLVGGQSVSLDLRRRCHELDVALVRSYGMTETAGGCVYDGVEVGDTLVRIRGGEVQLAGPSLATGYVGAPELTAASFLTEEARDGTEIRWYRTGDTGDLLGGMLTVTGRLDRVLISGGINVSLDEVERVASAHAGWDTAVAIAVPDDTWGQRVALVVETTPEAVPFAEVRAVLREQLGAAAAPDWVNEVTELPRLAGGKPDRRAIAAWLSELRESFRTTGAAGAGTPATNPNAGDTANEQEPA